MNILITGAAGFIGFHLIKQLQASSHKLYGIDNLNAYYDPQLKLKRLQALGFSAPQLQQATSPIQSSKLTYQTLDIANRQAMHKLFQRQSFDVVINLAAQAGVRYSIENPQVYIDSNVVGFANVLEGCRHSQVKHLIFASSSSVYGMNSKQPFSTDDRTDYPVSLYAATKKSNEMMAHCYSHLYQLPCTGLRFFTVYGPYGRPDMAYYKFTQAILAGKPIDVFNNGVMQRDFTYIDDIINAIERLITKQPKAKKTNGSDAEAPFALYNLGNNQPVTLRRFISAIENACGKKAIENHLPMQPGDVPTTYADVADLIATVDFKPNTSIEDGIHNFVAWYLTQS